MPSLIERRIEFTTRVFHMDWRLGAAPSERDKDYVLDAFERGLGEPIDSGGLKPFASAIFGSVLGAAPAIKAGTSVSSAAKQGYVDQRREAWIRALAKELNLPTDVTTAKVQGQTLRAVAGWLGGMVG